MVKPAGRARRIAMPPRDLARGSDEAVFKLISTTKSRATAKHMVLYVARARKSDRDDPTVAAVKLRDGEGEVLSRTDAAESFAGVRAAVDGAFEGLELTPEAENLKKDAAPSPPAAPPAGDLEPAPEVEIAPGGAAPPAGDLSRRQAYHFTFSAPLRQRAELIAFEEAARAAIEENFTDAGHRCLWAVHGEDVAGEGETQHGHAHVHMVVKAEHENGGPRLQIGAAGRDVRELRESFAAHAREGRADSGEHVARGSGRGARWGGRGNGGSAPAPRSQPFAARAAGAGLGAGLRARGDCPARGRPGPPQGGRTCMAVRTASPGGGLGTAVAAGYFCLVGLSATVILGEIAVSLGTAFRREFDERDRHGSRLTRPPAPAAPYSRRPADVCRTRARYPDGAVLASPDTRFWGFGCLPARLGLR